MSKSPRIKAKDRDTILQALAAGVVPRVGIQHIQVGRAAEIAALVRDIERLVDGGTAFRFVIGEYGSGKTFFLNLVRLIALEKKCVTVHADLSPNRRLHAREGQARHLYAEAVANLSTRTKPEGGALPSIVERFVSDCIHQAKDRGISVEKVIDEALAGFSDYVGGYDYATVIKAYWRGDEEGNERLKSDALRWLRAEYSTKTEARQAVGVRNIIDDDHFYDALKLLAKFVVLGGYSGLLIVLDEMVNLYKLQNARSRNQNYEQLLRMYNDSLHGGSSRVGFVMGGTPEFLMDTRRGLYSYEALQSRLAENTFAQSGEIDPYSPVIRLQNLTPEELYVLLGKVRHIFLAGSGGKKLLPDEGLHAFMEHCSNHVGEAYFRTPRNTIRTFVQLLAVLEQRPGADWRQLLSSARIEQDDVQAPDSEDDLASLRL